MVLEAAQLVGASVRSSEGKSLAAIDRIIFDGAKAQIIGFQIKQRAVLQKFSALNYLDVLDCGPSGVTVDSEQVFERDLKAFDQISQQFGPILNVTAKTESGSRLGKITDVVFDIETGLIIRFYVGALLQERIIPRQFLVGVTPKAIIFKDVVNQPLFDQIALGEPAI